MLLFLLVSVMTTFIYFPDVVGQTRASSKLTTEIGDKIDSLNGVYVYFNGGMNNVSGRNVTKDGYNLGLKFQCVEFVKRYYYQHLNHKMPNSWGHAVDFYKASVSDNRINSDRALIQFKNPSVSKPMVNDILVFNGWEGNPYGHVAIISEVGSDYIEIVQQNVGKNTRERLDLKRVDGKYRIENSGVLGWLGKR